MGRSSATLQREGEVVARREVAGVVAVVLEAVVVVVVVVEAMVVVVVADTRVTGEQQQAVSEGPPLYADVDTDAD